MLIYSFSQHLLSSYSSTGTVFGFRSAKLNKGLFSLVKKAEIRPTMETDMKVERGASVCAPPGAGGGAHRSWGWGPQELGVGPQAFKVKHGERCSLDMCEARERFP